MCFSLGMYAGLFKNANCKKEKTDFKIKLKCREEERKASLNDVTINDFQNAKAEYINVFIAEMLSTQCHYILRR